MKKQTLNTIAGKFFAGNLLIAALFFSSQARAAAILPSNDKTSFIADSVKADKMDITYVGISNNGLEFDVRYANLKGESFNFVIKDETGEVLYEKTYETKQFYKKVQLPEVSDAKSLVFSITTTKNKIVQSKEVKITPRYSDDVLVKIN